MNHTHKCVVCKKKVECNCRYIRRVNWACRKCFKKAEEAVSKAFKKFLVKLKILKGFTLIELMIVIAICGILLLVVLPQFNQMIRKSKEGTTKLNLGSLRATIATAYTNNEGVYPTDDLRSLVPAYISTIPLKDTPPYHEPGSDVSAGNIASQPASRGDWFYDNIPAEAEYGKVWVNCVHTDLKGIIWTVY